MAGRQHKGRFGASVAFALALLFALVAAVEYLATDGLRVALPYGIASLLLAASAIGLRAMAKKAAQTGLPEPGSYAREQKSVSPAEDEGPEQEARPPFAFDLKTFVDELVMAQDPIAYLRLVAESANARAQATENREDDVLVARLRPSPAEAMLGRLLEDAGILATDIELPQAVASVHERTGLVRLQIPQQSHQYLAGLRIRAAEAAVNTLQIAGGLFGDLGDLSEREAYRAARIARNTIALQAPTVTEAGDERGEWAIREAIAHALGSFELPVRASCDYRVNASAGNVSLVIELPPAEVFPSSEFIDGIGRVVTMSSQMRHQMASEYAARLALLFSATAFSASSRIKNVFVAGVVNTAARSRCHFSLEIAREAFATIDLDDVSSPLEALGRFPGNIEVESGALLPVAKTFSLEEARFCPPHRWDLDLSAARVLPDEAARHLCAKTTHDLSINEAAGREAVAATFVRHLGDTVEENVRAILEASKDSDDPTVHEAAKRCVMGLIEGTIPDDGDLAAALEEEFVFGDELGRRVRDLRGDWGLLDPDDAISSLERALFECDSSGRYADDEGTEWRAFLSHTERVIYNNSYALEGHEVRLVPREYFEAHLALCMLCSATGRHEDAVAHARRLVELDPVGSVSNLSLARSLELSGDEQGELDGLLRYLTVAHDSNGLGTAFYLVGKIMAGRGLDAAAQACFARSLLFPSIVHSQAFISLVSMSELTPSEDGTAGKIVLSADELDAALEAQGIPAAPSQETVEMFVNCMKAAVDAEVFPLARSLLRGVQTFGDDEVIRLVLRSLEDCPDGAPL